MAPLQKPLLYSLFSALLLTLAWYWHLGLFIFFAFVPLLLLEDGFAQERAAKRKLKFFGYTYLSFLLWNIGVTWWIVYASFGGACAAYFSNALLMTLVFTLYSLIRRSIHRSWSVWLLIPLWLAFEHIHTLWDITWTWLSLGNVFAFHHHWVQWYEFTGVSGGSAWILLVNILVYQIVRTNEVKTLWRKPVLQFMAVIVVPILFSRILLLTESPRKSQALDIVIVQPNIDPYNEKFDVGYQQQFSKMLRLARTQISKKTAYLILPETFITGIRSDLNEDDLNFSEEIQWFRDSLMHDFPQLKILTGGNSYRYYRQNETPSATSRLDSRTGLHYDVFNTALFIDGTTTQLYHKSKLVPGVEKMPFPALMKPLEGLAINLGGTMGSLGTQDERTVFIDKDRNLSLAPVICYESVYGDFVTGYTEHGAGLICIITNDGWWDDTPGHYQHLNYARLRAIENRREIARSANTGTSCFIDVFGNIRLATEWWQAAVIHDTVQTNTQLTFFARWGDLISYSSVALSALLLLFYLARLIRPAKPLGPSL